MASLLGLESPSSQPRPLPILFSSGNRVLWLKFLFLWETLPLTRHMVHGAIHHSSPSPAPTSGHRGGQVCQAETIRTPHLPKHSTVSTRWTLNPARPITSVFMFGKEAYFLYWLAKWGLWEPEAAMSHLPWPYTGNLPEVGKNETHIWINNKDSRAKKRKKWENEHYVAGSSLAWDRLPWIPQLHKSINRRGFTCCLQSRIQMNIVLTQSSQDWPLCL